MTSFPWYKDGLRFQCTECGKCCTGTAGFVWVSDDEIKSMAAALNLSEKNFKMRYIRNRGNRLALVEKKNEDGGSDCIFLKGKKCELYQSRPQQCRTFPWWQENLNTPESWKLAANSCEGISETAPVVDYETIQQFLKLNDSD